jgi:cytosine deaminase
MAEAGIAAIANPLINIVIQGRHDTYPKRRGMTRIPEMRERDILCAFGHDCVMDPWYSLGSGDMLEVAHMAVHIGHMTSREAMRFCFDAVTCNPARIMGLAGYGLEPGCNGDLVLLQAKDPIEAIRLKANRLAVVRRGRVIAETPARTSSLDLPDRPARIDPASYAPLTAGRG